MRGEVLTLERIGKRWPYSEVLFFASRPKGALSVRVYSDTAITFQKMNYFY